MLFHTWDFMLTTFVPFALTMIVALCTCIWFIKTSRSPKRRQHKNQLKKIWYIPILLLIPVVITAFLFLIGANHWIAAVLTSERITVSGKVDRIERAQILPLYWYDGEITPASYLTVGGRDYYIISDTGLSVGDSVTLEVCPEGNAVVRWQFDLHDGLKQGEEEPSKPVQSIPVKETAVYGIGLLTPMEAIVGIAVSAVVLIALQQQILRKRLKLLENCVTAEIGIVCARKISVWTCLTEFWLLFCTFVALLSDWRLFLLVAFGTGILWLLRLDTQRTQITYSGNQFTLKTATSTRTFLRNDVTEAQFIHRSKKQGFLTLQICMGSATKFCFNTLDFEGLDQFLAWINDAHKKTGDSAVS